MEIPDNTQGANQEANPNGATTIPQFEGNDTTSTQPQVEEKKVTEGKTFTQADLDNIAAKSRGTAERETRKKILAELGLKDDEMDKLSAFKEAYQNSLSDEEKRNQVMEDLQAENLTLAQDVEEKDYIIKALVQLTGKNEADVDKIVKMAKGLRTEDNTIEDAIKEVISMVNIGEQKPTVVVSNPEMPKGQELQQPSTNVQISTENNPFKQGSINLTKQSELMRNNPELAKKLASEAGVSLRF
jgi:hypothetical protein